jgi:hypothetical protein
MHSVSARTWVVRASRRRRVGFIVLLSSQNVHRNPSTYHMLQRYDLRVTQQAHRSTSPNTCRRRLPTQTGRVLPGSRRQKLHGSREPEDLHAYILNCRGLDSRMPPIQIHRHEPGRSSAL